MITEAVRESCGTRYGLDRPVSEQFVRYVTSVFRGDLGFSISHHRPVSDVLLDALPNTLLLMMTALVGGFALGIGTALAQVRNLGQPHRQDARRILAAFFSRP